MNRNRIAFWIFTGLFCFQMGFTAYAQLMLPQVGAAFEHLGFPDYFRVQLTLMKLVGVAVLLVPGLPSRIKEWTYAGFAFNLLSAVYAHVAVGDGVEAWGWAVGTAVLWAGSYFFWRRLESAPSTTLVSLRPQRA